MLPPPYIFFYPLLSSALPSVPGENARQKKSCVVPRSVFKIIRPGLPTSLSGFFFLAMTWAIRVETLKFLENYIILEQEGKNNAKLTFGREKTQHGRIEDAWRQTYKRSSLTCLARTSVSGWKTASYNKHRCLAVNEKEHTRHFLQSLIFVYLQDLSLPPLSLSLSFSLSFSHFLSLSLSFSLSLSLSLPLCDLSPSIISFFLSLLLPPLSSSFLYTPPPFHCLNSTPQQIHEEKDKKHTPQVQHPYTNAAVSTDWKNKEEKCLKKCKEVQGQNNENFLSNFASLFFEILSDLNQEVPNHLADESQTH